MPEKGRAGTNGKHSISMAGSKLMVYGLFGAAGISAAVAGVVLGTSFDGVTPDPVAVAPQAAIVSPQPAPAQGTGHRAVTAPASQALPAAVPPVTAKPDQPDIWKPGNTTTIVARTLQVPVPRKLARADAEGAGPPPVTGNNPPAIAPPQPMAIPQLDNKGLDALIKNSTAPAGPDAVNVLVPPPAVAAPVLARAGRCGSLGPVNSRLRPAMSLEEKIGQMIIIGFQGTSASSGWARKVAAQLARGEAGGVLFLKKNVASKRGVQGLARMFSRARSKLPAFVMIDQEGGRVQRLNRRVGWRAMPSARNVARSMNAQQARALYRRVGLNLKAWGFNVNLGPVSDVNVNPRNPIIARYGRSYSSRASVVAKFNRAFVTGSRAANVITALKHFPGHGSSARDSHKGFVNISASWQEKRELAPFKALIADGCADTVMMGHLFIDRYQDRRGGNDPATFSRKLITGVLRGRLGFTGVVITDDLDMGAIRKHYRPGTALIRAIRAGNDLLLVSNTAKPRIDRARWAVRIIAAEARRDRRFKALIEKSYRRILALKQRLRPARRDLEAAQN